MSFLYLITSLMLAFEWIAIHPTRRSLYSYKTRWWVFYLTFDSIVELGFAELFINIGVFVLVFAIHFIYDMNEHI